MEPASAEQRRIPYIWRKNHRPSSQPAQNLRDRQDGSEVRGEAPALGDHHPLDQGLAVRVRQAADPLEERPDLPDQRLSLRLLELRVLGAAHDLPETFTDFGL